MEPTTARGCSPIELPSRTSAASTSAGPRTWMGRARIPETGGATMAELPGKALAQKLIAQSREESRRTPMKGVIQAADEGSLSDEQHFRLIGRLWTRERMLYYVYGGRGQRPVG